MSMNDLSFDDVEFVTSAPTASFGGTAQAAAPARSKWTASELGAVLADASIHVRFLMHELAEGGEVPTARLKSKPVAYAQVQRICNSRGKESLVVPVMRGETRCYALHDAWRSTVAGLVAGAQQPPPSIPKPPGERKPRASRRSMQGSALDGIATSRGSVLSAAPAVMAPPRRVSQGQTGRSLVVPASIEIDFCKELLGFMNATANGTRYRIILEDDGYRLEAC